MGPKVDESPSKKALSNLITKRAVAKRRITQTFKCIGEVVLNSSTLSEIRTYSDLIRALLEEVKNFDDLINEIVCADYGGEEDSEFSDGSARELDQQSNYQISILKQLTVLSDRMSNVVSPQNRDAVQSMLLGCTSLADPGGVANASLADPGGASGASLAEPGGVSDSSLADEEAEPQE